LKEGDRVCGGRGQFGNKPLWDLNTILTLWRKGGNNGIVQIQSARKEFSGSDARRKQQMRDPKWWNRFGRRKQNTRIVSMPKLSMISAQVEND
jgi:hypothetical protein